MKRYLALPNYNDIHIRIFISQIVDDKLSGGRVGKNSQNNTYDDDEIRSQMLVGNVCLVTVENLCG